MKPVKLTTLILAIILTIVLISVELKAQTDPPNPCGVCIPCAEICAADGCASVACGDCIENFCLDPGIPINSHIILLLLSGVVYGVGAYKNGYLKGRKS